MRHAYHCVWHPRVKITSIHLLKFQPLAFMFVREPFFLGFPNMRSYLQANDDNEVEVLSDLASHGDAEQSRAAWRRFLRVGGPKRLSARTAVAGTSTDLGGADQVFFAEPLLHDPHPLRRILARKCKGLLSRSAKPCLEFFLSREQHRHALVIDRRDECVRRCRQERVRFNIDVGVVLLHRPLIPAPDAGERESKVLPTYLLITDAAGRGVVIGSAWR